MGLMNKLKNILFEDEEEEIPVLESNTKIKKETNNVVQNEDIRKRVVKEEPTLEEKKEPIKVEEVSPFPSFDEEEFERIAAINRNRLLERDRKAREAKELEKKIQIQTANEVKQERNKVEIKERRDTRDIKEYQTNNDNKKRYQPTSYVKEVPKPVHKFTPSPVISPVYGILDKNYRKEDLLPRASSEGTLPKVMDVDNVRKKAFGALEQLEKDPLSKFDSNDVLEKQQINDLLNDDVKDYEEDDVLTKTASIKIVGLEDSFDEPVIDIKPKEEEIKIMELPKSYEHENDKIVVTNDLEKESLKEDTLESDLFNLIDSMYEKREEK